jgi:hypothetical protein
MLAIVKIAISAIIIFRAIGIIVLIVKKNFANFPA